MSFVVTVEFTPTEAQLLEYFLAQKGLTELADRVRDARHEILPPVILKEIAHEAAIKNVG